METEIEKCRNAFSEIEKAGGKDGRLTITLDGFAVRKVTIYVYYSYTQMKMHFKVLYTISAIPMEELKKVQDFEFEKLEDAVKFICLRAEKINGLFKNL